MRIHPAERVLTMPELEGWLAEGHILEIFTVGTAVIVAPVGRIGYEGRQLNLPSYDGGLGPIGGALHTRITDIQDGRYEWEDWSVKCE